MPPQETQKSTYTGGSREPRWPAIVAVLAVGGLYAALPQSLSYGPRWLPLILVTVLLIPTIITHRIGQVSLSIIFGHLTLAVVTIEMVISLYLLVHALPSRREDPTSLLHSAIALWVTNILVFASWYWRLDAGGPHVRELRGAHTEGAFLFPQMTMTATARKEAGELHWTPGFIDYLFLAFNTSTALSPADTAVLSRWAKVLVMTQAMISLGVVALLGARAVNIL